MRYSRALLLIIIILLTVLLGHFYDDGQTDNYQSVSVTVTRVVDGDTIDTGIGRVRLLGINTPEKGQPLYGEAKSFLEGFVNKSLILSYSSYDKYGRILGYLYYNDLLINQMILSEGWANSYYYVSDSLTDDLLSAESQAINSGNGLWNRSSSICGSCFVLDSLSNDDVNDCIPGMEVVVLRNSCAYSCVVSSWSLKDDANHILTLPDNTIIPSGSFMRVLNGKGDNDIVNKVFFIGNSPIGSCSSVWNDDHDSLFFRDDVGGLVLFHRY